MFIVDGTYDPIIVIRHRTFIIQATGFKCNNCFGTFEKNFTLGYEEIQSLKPSRTVLFSTTTTRTSYYEDISLTIVSSKGNYKGDGTERHKFHKPISKLF